MNIFLRSRFALAAFFTMFAISAAVAGPSLIINKQCTETVGKNFSLYLTVPTGGYELSIVRTMVKKGIVNVAVKYTAPSGPATQSLETHVLRFTLSEKRSPKRYTVTANGEKLGRAKPIEQIATIAGRLD